MTKIVRAYTNIALIKYWGKEDEVLRLPSNSSLSLTLNEFYTETSVTYDEALQEDVFILDGVLQTGVSMKRVQDFMNLVRKNYGLSSYAKIVSSNHVPTAAGLASSASAFAALAKAATLSLNLDDEELSRLARKGSGSASRSIYGGFVTWHKGTEDQDSFAQPVEMEMWPTVRMITCLVNQNKKPFSSSTAMNETKRDSVYFDAWVKQSEKDLIAMTSYLKDHDIHKVGQLAQENALRMHASLLAVNKWYFETQTIEIMNKVRELQKRIPVYFTMDAGPNVKLLTEEAYIEEIIEALGDHVKTIVSGPGPGVEVR